MGVVSALGLMATFFLAPGAAARTPLAAPVASPAPAAAPSAPVAAPSAPARSFSVTPGGAGSPLASWPKGKTPQLVWTGFQVTASGSRVFVQLTHDVDLDVQPIKGGLAVTLHRCRIHMRNNSRTLDTRFFASPVTTVSVHQRKGGVELDIALKEPSAATPRKESGPGGSQFWVLDFAPSDAAKPATASAE
jgi:hypothetical protein